MHIREYIRQLVRKNLNQKVLGKDDLLIECEVIVQKTGNDIVVQVKDMEGNDVTEFAEAHLRKGDVSHIVGLYTIIKFEMN